MFPATLHMGLKVFAKNSPHHEAICYEDKVLTFREVYERCNALANSLLEIGVKKGDHIAVYMRNRLESAEIYYAISAVGAVCIPMNYMITGDSLVHLLRTSDSRYLFVEEEQLSHFEKVAPQLEQIRPETTIVVSMQPVLPYHHYEKLLAAGSTKDLEISVLPDDPAAILFSSGTTSLPKGVVLTQEVVLQRLLRTAIERKINYTSKALVSTPIYHSVGHSHMFYLSVFGCRLVISREFQPEKVLQLIQNHQVTHAFFVPTQYYLLLQLPTFEQYDLSSLKMLVAAAAPLSEGKKRQIIEKFNCELTEFFGSTETSMFLSLRPREVVKKAASLGQQCDFVEVRLVDDQGNDVAAGEDGEFVIRGPVLFSHYYNLPQETAESMLPDGWFRTGDMGYQDEEQFYYLRDRKKDMIISGGVNIYPKDIEEVLLMHPDVFEAAVIGFPDEVWGEAVKAFVVLKESAQCDPEELLLFSNEKLAKFQRIKALEFVSSLPRNPSGKVLKRELRLR
ncbi:MAG: hypothetical protein K0R47_1763 [Brevibacillus sp.]|nr:hypothetical protein [Brevibacillus sp.]